MKNPASGTRLRRTRRRRRSPFLYSVLIGLLGAAVLAAYVLQHRPAPKVLPDALVDASIGTAYKISAPSAGDVTDGGLLVRAAASQSATLDTAKLLFNGTPSPLQATDIEIIPVAATLDDAVGMRQGPPAVMSTAQAMRPLKGQTVDGSAAGDYEILFGIHAPVGGGPWRVNAVEVGYSHDGVAQEQIFTHNLTVCASTATGDCGPGGSLRVAPQSSSAKVAAASCKTDTKSVVTGKPITAWLASNVHSAWVGSAGATISLSTTAAAEVTRTSTTSHEYEGGLGLDFNWLSLSGSAKKKWETSLAESVSYSSTWTYAEPVPQTITDAQRATVFILGWQLPVTTTVTRADCQKDYVFGSVYAPAAGTDKNSNTCIALDTYPGIHDLGPRCLDKNTAGG